MNIEQTRQILSYIWSTHPSSPKYTDSDKARTIAAYFRVLYKYAINDVLAAVDAVCLANPTFIPSAYEIEAKCQKTVNVDFYLPKRYHELDKEIYKAEQFRNEKKPEYQKAFDERSRILGNAIISLMDKGQKELLRNRLEPLERTIEDFENICAGIKALKQEREELYIQATWKAYEDYDSAQAQMAKKDLNAIDCRMNALEG